MRACLYVNAQHSALLDDVLLRFRNASIQCFPHYLCPRRVNVCVNAALHAAILINIGSIFGQLS